MELDRTRTPPEHSKAMDLEAYDLIIGRRGSKGYCSRKVHSWLTGWYQQYANTKYKSSLLQQQVYPEFLRNNFKAYRKDSQGAYFLEENEANIIAKLKKEMEVIRVKGKENMDDSQRKRKGDVALGGTRSKKTGRASRVRPAPSNRDDYVTLEGDDFLLEAYMDEIPFKPTGLGTSPSPSAFRAPGFHLIESGPVSVNESLPEHGQHYVKDAFHWQEFESYAIPPSLGQESGSPTTSTILRSISSGMYVSPETIPESQQNDTSTSMNNTKHSVSWADQTTTTLNHQYNTACGIEKKSQLPFSDSSVGDQMHHTTVPAVSNRVFDSSCLFSQTDKVIDSTVGKDQGETHSPATNVATKETFIKKLSKGKPFNGPSPISFQVLNPSRTTPPLAPKPPPNLFDVVMGAFKHLEHRAEALERENMAVWSRLRELELKYDAILSSSNKQDCQKNSNDETPAIFEV